MKRNRSLLTGTLVAAALLISVTAATTIRVNAPQQSVRLSGAQRAAIIDSISAAMIETYIFLDVAEEMAGYIRGRLRGGEYDDIFTPEEFARRLTTDLQSISNDLHLRINFAPPTTGRRDRPDPEAQQRQLDQLRRENFRFQKVEILPGNIGYLKFNNFIDASIAGDTAIAAMNFLANADALIIDLRANGGGAPSMIQLISSYFFDEPVHLNSFYIRQTDEWEQYWTHAHVDGPRMVDVPIFVLTSGNTFSAAEEFTYNLKNLERATIIGETTRGGAHPVTGRIFNFGGFAITMSLPYGRAVNPITGTNWEGTGIEPHIKVPADQALERAIEEARKAIEGR